MRCSGCEVVIDAGTWTEDGWAGREVDARLKLDEARAVTVRIWNPDLSREHDGNRVSVSLNGETREHVFDLAEAHEFVFRSALSRAELRVRSEQTLLPDAIDPRERALLVTVRAEAG